MQKLYCNFAIGMTAWCSHFQIKQRKDYGTISSNSQVGL